MVGVCVCGVGAGVTVLSVVGALPGGSTPFSLNGGYMHQDLGFALGWRLLGFLWCPFVLLNLVR